MTGLHFSSQSNEWATPQDFFDALNLEFGFTLDVAANAENAKCERFYSVEDDGLSKSWQGETVWMNPPYGREIKEWVRKAKEESERGATVVALIPARVDTSYWHEHIFGQPNVEYRFVKGRLKFGTARHGAPFPSAVVVFRPCINSYVR